MDHPLVHSALCSSSVKPTDKHLALKTAGLSTSAIAPIRWLFAAGLLSFIKFPGPLREGGNTKKKGNEPRDKPSAITEAVTCHQALQQALLTSLNHLCKSEAKRTLYSGARRKKKKKKWNHTPKAQGKSRPPFCGVSAPACMSETMACVRCLRGD